MRTVKLIGWGRAVRIKVDISVYQVVGGQITKQTITYGAVSAFTDVSLELL